MRTQEQDVVTEKAQLAVLKTQFMAALNAYNNVAKAQAKERDSAALECQQAGNAYFNHAEEFVGNSDLLGAHSSSLWAQGFAEDCAEILKSMPSYFEFLGDAFHNSARLSGLEFRPGSTSYANMQRMVVRYLTKDEVLKVKGALITAGLPIYGFENKVKNYMQRDKYLSAAFGVVFVLVAIALALYRPDPTKFQYTVFRTVLALAAAGFGAVIPGTIQVKVGKFVRAGGALALFAIVYFYAPAQLT